MKALGKTKMLRKSRGVQKRTSLELETRTINNHSKEEQVHASQVLYIKIIRVGWSQKQSGVRKGVGVRAEVES